MRKSTILLLVIVYILSFLAIGLLGQAVRSYDPVVYPESITLIEPDDIATVHKDTKIGDKMYNYYFVVRPYREGMSIRFKAEVKPDNTKYPNVDFFKDESDQSFNLVTHDDDSSIEQNYVVISLNKKPNPVVTTNFYVRTQTSGERITLYVGVTFVKS